MELRNVVAAGTGGFRDRFDVKAADWFQKGKPNRTVDLALLGVPLSKTSISHSAAFQFPQTVRAALAAMNTYHMDSDTDVSQVLSAWDIGDVQMHVTDLSLCLKHVYEAVCDVVTSQAAKVVFLVGGDHGITAESVRAVQNATKRPIGIIHFDAHHDMRNVLDGGPTNGTPFRRLLESEILEGRRLVQIGLRNFANARAYTQFAKEHGVTLFTMDALARQGLTSVLEQAINIASADNALVYVSFDLDVLDPFVAPGVPAPTPGGMSFFEAAAAVQTLLAHPQVQMFDIVCADPTVDVRNFTSRVAAALILYAAVGLCRRTEG